MANRETKADTDEKTVPVETPTVEERTLTTTTVEEAKASGVVLTGAADKWLCIAKAVNKDEGWMRSTKAMQIGAAGCLVQTSYIWTNSDGTKGCFEAVCFAPSVNLIEEGGKARFLT